MIGPVSNFHLQTDITGITQNIGNLSLSATQPNISESETVDNFIKMLQADGWVGDTATTKEFIIVYGYLNLEKTLITTLPNEIGDLPNLRYLSLEGTQITVLPPEIKKLTSVHALKLNNTKIQTLPPEIGQLPNLKELELNNTPLSSLPPEIGQLGNLEVLKLSNTKIQTLPPEIGQLPNLKELDLNNTPLNSLPPEIGDLLNLEILNLTKTQIAALPPDIKKLSKLYKLQLQHTLLTTLPPEIGDLSALECLILSGTQIAILPPEIGNLSLKFLDLGSTPLKILPLEIKKLLNLQNLILSGTQIAILPPEIGNLSKLKFLDLGSTPLKILPPEIKELLNLQSLILWGAQIAILPPEIGKLPKLEILDLRHTPLKILPPEIKELLNLRKLSVGWTQIAILPPEIGNLSKLEILEVEETPLVALPPELGNLPLRVLKLGNIQLTALPPELGNLRNLSVLSLVGAPIRTLPSVIKKLTQLIILNLSFCPIVAQGDETNLGRRELRAHFGDRVVFSDASVKQMPADTTKEEVYKALDEKSLRVNRERLRLATLPEISDMPIEDGVNFLFQFNIVISQLNFNDETAPGYLSHTLLANDYANDVKSNWEKIRTNVVLRLTGYFKTLYDMPLDAGETQGWQMNDDKKPALKKALSYILKQLIQLEDPDQRAMLFTQFVHGMLYCPTGQKEGIDTVIIALLNAKTMLAGDIESQVHTIIALKKAEFFKIAILKKAAENSQNVHLISGYEELLREELGLRNPLAHKERRGIMGADPFNNNPNNVLKIFYELVIPERMAFWILEKVESAHEVNLCKELGELEKKQEKFSAKKTLEARLAAAPVKRHAEIQIKIASLQNESHEDVSDEISKIKAQIKKGKQLKPITTQTILTYLIDNKIVDTEQETWWSDYFSASLEDETAHFTHRGAMMLLTKLGYISTCF